MPELFAGLGFVSLSDVISQPPVVCGANSMHWRDFPCMLPADRQGAPGFARTRETFVAIER
jgi:hypothetical protein